MPLTTLDELVAPFVIAPSIALYPEYFLTPAQALPDLLTALISPEAIALCTAKSAFAIDSSINLT